MQVNDNIIIIVIIIYSHKNKTKTCRTQRLSFKQRTSAPGAEINYSLNTPVFA